MHCRSRAGIGRRWAGPEHAGGTRPLGPDPVCNSHCQRGAAASSACSACQPIQRRIYSPRPSYMDASVPAKTASISYEGRQGGAAPRERRQSLQSLALIPGPEQLVDGCFAYVQTGSTAGRQALQGPIPAALHSVCMRFEKPVPRASPPPWLKQALAPTMAESATGCCSTEVQLHTCLP